MKKKRKPRKKLSESNNLLVPFDITKLGSEDDPCFGKLYDPKAEGCKICGDSEFCSIVLNQQTLVKRQKIEKKTRFLDLEEEEIQMEPTHICYKRIEKAGGKWVSIDILKKHLVREGKTQKEVRDLEINGFFKRLANSTDIKVHSSKRKFKWI